MKKVTAVILLICVLCSIPVSAGAAANPFTDVAETDWHYEYVMYCYENGLTNGVSTTAYEPYEELTRAQYAAFLARIIENSGVDISGCTSLMSDVEAGSWYEEYVHFLAANSLAFGTGAMAFSPNEPITREDMMLWTSNVLLRYTDLQASGDSSLTFADSDEVSSSSHKKAIANLVSWGIISGNDKNELNPQDALNRAEAAKVISYVDGLVPVQADDNGNASADPGTNEPSQTTKAEPDNYYLNAEEREEQQAFVDNVMNLKITSLSDEQKEIFIGYWVGYYSDKYNAEVKNVVIVNNMTEVMTFNSISRTLTISQDLLNDLSNTSVDTNHTVVYYTIHEVAGHGSQNNIKNNEYGIAAALLGKYSSFTTLFNKVYTYQYKTRDTFNEVRAYYLAKIESLKKYKKDYNEIYSSEISAIEGSLRSTQMQMYAPVHATRSSYQVTKEEYTNLIKDIYSYLNKTTTDEEKQQLYDLIYFSAYYIDYQDAPQYDEMMKRVNTALNKAKTEINMNGVDSVLPSGAAESEIEEILGALGID